jgi:adenylate cyclase
MGFEDEVEQSIGRPCRQFDGRSERPNELTSSIVPARGHHSTVGWISVFLLSDLILYCSHAAATSLVQRNSVPSTHMRCMITANRRASATIAFFIPRCLAIFIAQAFAWHAHVPGTGRELGVRYILEGSVRKVGNRVRIASQLIEAETGGHLWAERYDRPLEDVFAVQDEITLSVVGAIEPSLRHAEIERVKRKRPDSLDAYDLVLRALPLVYIAMPKEAAEAVPLLQRALALEPDYAGAHGFLAWCHEILFVRAGFSQENHAAAIRHGHAAIAHGRDDATALALGAFTVALVEHDRVTAFEAFEQALALSPSSSVALFFGSVALAYSGEAERAIEWAERALRVSPFDRLNYLAYHGLAVGYFLRGRHEEAANAGRHAVQSNPGFSVSHMLLAAPLAKLGRMEEAKAVGKRVLELQPSFSAGGFCAALELPTLLAKPMAEAWCAAGLPP